VSSLALPYRIALVAMLAVGAVWFTFLRPKPPEAAPSPAAPGVTGLGNAVKGAQSATGASNAAAAQRPSAADAVEPAGSKTPATPAGSDAAAKPAKSAARGKAGSAAAANSPARGKVGSAAAAKPAAPAKSTDADASAPLLRHVQSGRVVVLLFSSRRGSDDAAVRSAVRELPRHRGRVVVKQAPLGSVGRYEAITRGVKILASPTVLVIGAGPTARTIPGFTTSAEIDQAVGDMLVAGKRG
jgi:hypothetical protein